MRALVFFLIIALSNACFADCNGNATYELTIPETKVPQLPSIGTKTSDFIPSGWRLLEQVTDDFNRDGLDDIAITLVENNPKNIIKNECGLGLPEFNSNPYAVLVALKKKDTTYQLAASDFKIIPRLDSPVLEQPYDSIGSKNGILAVSYHFWQSAGSWSTSSHAYKFRFQDKCMRLIGHDYGWRHRASGEETQISTNFLTGKYITSKFSPDSNHHMQSKHKLKNNPPYCLGNVLDRFEHID